MNVRIFTVDAFTDQRFRGNPAGVCLLDKPLPDQLMQQIAAEMNLAETAFVWPEAGSRRLRWMTPKVEVDLCGHATLATAHVLYQEKLAEGKITFQTRSGELTVQKPSSSLSQTSPLKTQLLEMDFPAVIAKPAEINRDVINALGVKPIEYSVNSMDAVVTVATEAEVRQCKPDFRQLGNVSIRGLILTARSAQPYDFISRFFAPAVGIDEDPVTGSAHCCLAPYWAEKLGKNELVGYQASERGGVVRVRVGTASGSNRVALIGEAVTVLRGELLLD
jgi:PhzF family phenazine biosynthesis protein